MKPRKRLNCAPFCADVFRMLASTSLTRSSDSVSAYCIGLSLTESVMSASPDRLEMFDEARKWRCVLLQLRKVFRSVSEYPIRCSGVEGTAVKSVFESKDVGVELGLKISTVSLMSCCSHSHIS